MGPGPLSEPAAITHKRMTGIKTLLIAVCVTVVGLCAQAADYAYDHNGSRMRVSVEDNQVRIYYAQPRPGLVGAGVQPGTLLFDGQVADTYLDGSARIFNANCGEVDYFVYGDFVPGRTFTLQGAATVLSGFSCRIVNTTYDGPDANLVFQSLGQNVEVAPVARGCVKGVNSTLNVRVGPGASFARIAELAAGQCGVQILERCQDNWCAVQTGNVFGWVSMEYLQR